MSRRDQIIMTPDEVASSTARGQYATGWIGGEEVPSYAADTGLERSSTETYVAMRLFVEFESRAEEEGIGDAWWAYAYAAVGDREQSLERLRSAVNERSSVDQTPLTMLRANPWGDPDLDTPEFRELLDGLWDQ